MLSCVDLLGVDDAANHTVGRCTVTTVYLHSDIPTQCALRPASKSLDAEPCIGSVVTCNALRTALTFSMRSQRVSAAPTLV